MRFNVAFLILAVLIGFGCKNDDDFDPPVRERSYLHILGAVPTDTFDIHFDYWNADNRVIPDFFYKRNFPLAGYADLEAGGQPDDFGNGKLFLSAIRQNFINSPLDTLMVPTDIILEPNEFSTVCLADDNGTVRLAKFEDVIPATDSGKTAIRFINLKSSLPISSLSSTNGTIVLNNIAFMEASPFMEIPTGSYNLELKDDGGGVVTTMSIDLLQSRGGYSFYVSGNGTGNLAWFRH